jgi:hypothetical protein
LDVPAVIQNPRAEARLLVVDEGNFQKCTSPPYAFGSPPRFAERGLKTGTTNTAAVTADCRRGEWAAAANTGNFRHIIPTPLLPLYSQHGISPVDHKRVSILEQKFYPVNNQFYW